MNPRIPLCLMMSLAVLVGSCGEPETGRTPVAVGDWPSDNEILAMVLKASRNEGFTVVDAETSESFLSPQKPEYGDEAEEMREYVLGELQQMGVDGKKLLDGYDMKNRKPVRLTLESSPEDGYLVDYEGKYAAYFNENGGGWEKWYEENPNADGSTEISLPACDEENGIILIYVGTQTHWLTGMGHLIVYRYKGGNLTEVGRVELWIS